MIIDLLLCSCNYSVLLLELYTPKRERKRRCCKCCRACLPKGAQDGRDEELRPGVMLEPSVLERTDAFYTGPQTLDNDSGAINKQLSVSFSRHFQNDEAVSGIDCNWVGGITLKLESGSLYLVSNIWLLSLWRCVCVCVCVIILLCSFVFFLYF